MCLCVYVCVGGVSQLLYYSALNGNDDEIYDYAKCMNSRFPIFTVMLTFLYIFKKSCKFAAE